MIKAAVTAVWLLAVAGTVAAQVDPVDESARKALALGKYAQVVDLYSASLNAGRTLPAMSHYRMAIALQKQGDAPDAWKHLRLALAANPQGTFASSPARLAELRSGILAACRDLGRPECEERPTAKEAPSGDPDPAATAAAPTAPAAVPEAAVVPQLATDIARPATPATLRTLGAAAPAVTGGFDGGPISDGSRWGAATLAVAVATLLIASWIAWRTYRRDRRIPEGLDSVESLRDNVAAFLTALHGSQRGRDSALYLPLASLLPLLEREAGRTLYRATGNTKALEAADLKAVELSKQLTRKPLDVLTASPQEIEAHFRNVPV